jgi:hypothetical protein
MLIPYSLTVFVLILSFVLSMYDFYERRGAQMRLGVFPFVVAAISVVAAIVYILLGRMHMQDVTINNGFAGLAALMLVGAIRVQFIPRPGKRPMVRTR